MTIIVQELRYAIRDLLARPAWSLLVVAVLATGLATVLYVLAILDGLLLRPLPFAQPEQLYAAGTLVEGDDHPDSVPQRDRDDIARRLEGVADVAGWSDGTVNLLDGERAERYDGSFVTANLFATLGVAPLIGSDFHADDAAPGAPMRVVIGHEMWQTRFLGDPSIVGRAVRVNGESATVIAVMPEKFSFPRRAAIWVAARASGTPKRNGDRQMQIVFRLSAEHSLAQVQTALDGWHGQALKEEPNYFRNARPVTVPLIEYFTDQQTRLTMGVMFMATLLVLLVACGNAANLMLARHLGRQQELAVRMAIGASRWRIVVHMFAHSLLLSVVAAAVALACAHWALHWTLQALMTADEAGPPAWMSFDLSLTMLGWTVAAAVLTAALSGLWPAIKLSSGALTSLRDGGRGSVGGGFARVGGVLVAIEIALSATLLIGTLAMVQTVRALDNFDLGVRTDHVLTARLGLFDSQYPTPESRVQLYERLVARLQAEGDVDSATVASALPGIMGPNQQLLPESAAQTDAPHTVGISTVDEHFAGTYQTRLLSGRWIDSRDRADSDPVAMVDRDFVERLSPNEEVLGKRFRLAPGDPDTRVVTVIGVTEALTIDDADDDAEAVVLVPQTQRAPTFASLAVRIKGDPEAFKPRLVALMHEIDRDTPLYWVRTYDEVIRVANFGQQLLVKIYAVFGLAALLLAAGGLYGVVGFTVTQRTREIGVRRALGATPGAVLSSILRRSAWQVGLGLAFGLTLGIPFVRALSASLDGTVGLDPWIWILVATVLATIALIASIVPARRALGVDAMVALRHE